MHPTLNTVIAQTILPSDLPSADLELARRIATEVTRYGVGVLPRDFYEGPSGRRLARFACEDVEGVRRMMACFEEREITVEVRDEVEEPGEGDEPVRREVTRQETRRVPPRVIEISEGRGLISLVLGLTWPDREFMVREDDHRRRWLWQRVLLSLGIRNVQLLPPHARVAPGEWDVVLVKDAAPTRAMDLAGSLLSAGGQLLLWQDREQAKGLRRRHLDARSRPLRLADAVALQSPPAAGRLVALIRSSAEGLDSEDEAA